MDMMFSTVHFVMSQSEEGPMELQPPKCKFNSINIFFSFQQCPSCFWIEKVKIFYGYNVIATPLYNICHFVFGHPPHSSCLQLPQPDAF